MHWLDEAIATLTREAARWKSSHGDKADSHATAAAILTQVAESGATHEDVKAHLRDDPSADLALPRAVVDADSDISIPTTSHDPAADAAPSA